MIRKRLNVDGPFLGFLGKCGQLIALSVLWLLGCIPVFTICTSCAALYHAVTRSVRGGEGSPVKEFYKCFRANLLNGAALSAILVGALVGLEAVSVFLMNSLIPAGVICVLMILDLFLLLYAGPVTARFQLGILETLKLSFVLSLQYAHYTFVFLIGTLALVVLQVFVLPMATVLFLPGVWCLVISLLMEKALNHYTPVDDGWNE
ncbi:MAG: DUF624 domain-containing protein [Faecousia sp.]